MAASYMAVFLLSRSKGSVQIWFSPRIPDLNRLSRETNQFTETLPAPAVMAALPVVFCLGGVHGLVCLFDQFRQLHARMIGGQGASGGEAEVLCLDAGPGCGIVLQAGEYRGDLVLSHLGQNNKLVAASPVAAADSAEGLLNAPGCPDDQLVPGVVPDGVVGGLQPVDINRKGGVVVRNPRHFAVALQVLVIGVTAVGPGQRVLHQFFALLADMRVRGHLVELRIMDKHQARAHGQPHVGGAEFPAQYLLDEDADDHQQQHGIKGDPVPPHIAGAVGQELGPRQHDDREIHYDIDGIQRPVGIAVSVVDDHHPPGEEAQELENRVADQYTHEGLPPPVVQLDLRHKGAAGQGREDVIDAFHRGKHPLGNSRVPAQVEPQAFREGRKGNDCISQVEPPFILAGDPAVFPDQNAKHQQRSPAQRDQRSVVSQHAATPFLGPSAKNKNHCYLYIYT